MAAAGYSITISASDHASKTIDGINKRIASIRAPIERMQKSLTKFGDVSGIKALASGFTDLTRSTWGAYQNISRIVDPLGIIAGAGSIAGIAALERNFANLGQTLTNTGRLMNMDPAKLAQWENAGKLVGVAVSETDSALRGLQKTATDARYGQNPKAAGMLQTILGPNWQKESQDIPGTVMKISKYLGTLTGAARANAIGNIEGYFSMNDGFTSSLLRGPAALAANLKKAQALGSPTDSQIAGGDSLAQTINASAEAVANLGTSIASKLQPVLQPMIDNFTRWVAANRNLISSDITKVISGFAKAIASINYDAVFKHLQRAFDIANKVAMSVGGWQNAIEGVIGILTASKVASIALPFMQLSSAIGMLSGGGAGSISALGAALRGIGFGVVGGQIVKLGISAAGGSAGLAAAGQDVTTGAIFGASIGGLPGAAAGAALGAAYWGLSAKTGHAASANLPPDIAAQVKASAVKYGVPVDFALAQFRAEGGGYNNVSGAGAFGPAQLMPKTAAMLGVATDPKAPGYDWKANVDAGIRYDAGLMKHYNRQMALVAAGYNMGPTATDKWIAAGHNVTDLNSQTSGYIDQIIKNGGISTAPSVAEPGNIGFGFTPSGAPSRLLPPVGEGVGRERSEIDIRIHHDGKVTAHETRRSTAVKTNIHITSAMPAVGGP